MESTTTPAAYYQPPPEKLAGLGFGPFQPSGTGYDLVAHNYARGWRIFCESEGSQRMLFQVESGADLFDGRLRIEAEFDLLFWQIGWTDVEPD